MENHDSKVHNHDLRTSHEHGGQCKWHSNAHMIEDFRKTFLGEFFDYFRPLFHLAPLVLST